MYVGYVVDIFVYVGRVVFVENLGVGFDVLWENYWVGVVGG